MKLFPTSPRDARVNTEDSLGHGMDAVMMLAIFLGLGYGLDRAFGTIPVFMIAMTLLGAVGIFARFYYSYKERMDEHEAQRTARIAGVAASASRRTVLVDEAIGLAVPGIGDAAPRSNALTSPSNGAPMSPSTGEVA